MGLGVAFGAALFSTVFRDSGNLWATVTLASVSLLVAVTVGLTTVPYLARRAAAERQRHRFEYAVTWVGGAYVLVTMVIAIAALNTGNNLLYIIVSAMLAAILVSGVASSVVLRGLRLDVHVPERVFAGQPVRARIVLSNKKRWLPSFSLRVVPIPKPGWDRENQWQWETSTFSFPPRRWGWPALLHIPDRSLRRVLVPVATPGIFDGMAYFPVLRAGSDARSGSELSFPQRGIYSERAFGIATRFPFAFFTKTLHVQMERQILVYPKIIPLDWTPETEIRITGATESATRGPGSDLHRIREYQAGDSARHLDWKASARSTSLMVREFSREDERRLRIVFDNPCSGILSEEHYERLVAVAASLAWQLFQQHFDVYLVGPSTGLVQDVYGFLAELATIQPEAPPQGVFVDPGRVRGFSDDGILHVIVTSRSASSIPSVRLERASVLQVLADGQVRSGTAFDPLPV